MDHVSREEEKKIPAEEAEAEDDFGLWIYV